MTVAGKKIALKTVAGPKELNIRVISFHVPVGPQNSAVLQRVLAATKIVPIISECNVEMTMGAEIKAIAMDRGLIVQHLSLNPIKQSAMTNLSASKGYLFLIKKIKHTIIASRSVLDRYASHMAWSHVSVSSSRTILQLKLVNSAVRNPEKISLACLHLN